MIDRELIHVTLVASKTEDTRKMSYFRYTSRFHYAAILNDSKPPRAIIFQARFFSEQIHVHTAISWNIHSRMFGNKLMFRWKTISNWWQQLLDAHFAFLIGIWLTRHLDILILKLACNDWDIFKNIHSLLWPAFLYLHKKYLKYSSVCCLLFSHSLLSVTAKHMLASIFGFVITFHWSCFPPSNLHTLL